MSADSARSALVLTTSFPATATDYAGNFVAHGAGDLASRGWRVRVLAPPGEWAPLGVQRLPYRMPKTLAEVRGIPDHLQTAPIRGALSGLQATIALWRVARRLTAPHELIIAHWLLPCGLVATHLGPTRPGHGKAPVHGIAHGGDIALLEQLPGGRKIARRIDTSLAGITFVSDDLRARFATLLGRPAQCRVAVLPMGIAPTSGSTEFAHRVSRMAKGRRVVLTVGRLTPIKGLHVLVEALRQVDDVVWMCAGDGPEADRLQLLSEANGIDQIALGVVSPAQRDALLSIADVFVLPSLPQGRRTEGTPTALLEALAAGTPCIVSDTGGVGAAARVADAAVVAPGDPSALRAMLLALLADGSRRKAMSMAHRRVGERYLWDEIGAQHAAEFGKSCGH